MSLPDISNQFALDMQGIQRLKHSAGRNPDAGLPEAARQFEALLVHRMLKSMRDAIPESDLTNSSQTRFYTELFDQQLAQHLSGRGIGLADQLVQQLSRGDSMPPANNDDLIAGIPRGNPLPLTQAAEQTPENFLDAVATQVNAGASPDRDTPALAKESPAVSKPPETELPQHKQGFIDTLAAPARHASRATGIPAELILAQAALETGWGRHGIPRQDGGNSHNLFGIKAGRHWQGATTDVVTHEFIDGRKTRLVDTFRVYESYEHAFTDYARLISDNPRYASVLAADSPAQAARALQRSGYATDPAYADKLISVMASLGPIEETPSRLAMAERLFGSSPASPKDPAFAADKEGITREDVDA
ncbi:flagellar assembly peptidoglycan hydrolase FlgJ [Halomonas marinisediminis]|uniref:Peptidoglycan hydrolase FlgJ n=1 Tax=Halomonas marinisediminis TaxID=2546095 RepID=A0ABY2D5F8_9GAMM|nr:flagellar assembly peptidoglycan hydrolase FlgJ [Halomonas marinisediminis]TDB01926.1 flagellar assembly peptidoglycan hydrolase FlgJ [Halomonas marinisediminis]